MTPEKRDDEIEEILEVAAKLHNGYATATVCINEDSREAITECWRKAKAWDRHYAYLESLTSGAYSRALVLNHMDSLIPPEPITPLGKLEAWVKDEKSRVYSTKPCLRPVDILDKIAELMKEEERR